MLTIRRRLIKYTQKITLIMILIIIVVSTIVQIINEHNQQYESGKLAFEQIRHILQENQQELDKVQEEYRNTCLNNAEAIGYIIQNNPSILEDVDELNKIAEFVEVDEIHIFDETGKIFAGTHPEYFGYTFDSGEQMRFFKRMLKDKMLKLCQDITPNTAQGKLMQYSALWSENGKFIIQVGMEPVRVMRATEKNELSSIFALLRINVGVNFYAIDEKSGEIVGSTNLEDVGKYAHEIGFDLMHFEKYEKGHHIHINGVPSFGVFTKIDGNLVGRIVSNNVLYEHIFNNIASLIVWFILIDVIWLLSITKHVNKYVIHDIYKVNDKLRLISEGDLDEVVDVETSVEFSELSRHINEMVKSLLFSEEKISYVLNKTNMRIGIYEYNEHMKNVRFTEYVSNILMLDKNETKELSSNSEVFKAYMDRLRKNPVIDAEGVFQVEGDSECYVKIEEVIQDNDVFGMLIDVTEDTIRRKQIEAERDIDLLTGLYNRRGMEYRLSVLFKTPENLGYAAFIMIDADGLKGLNDKYGHEMGDLYLKKIADVLASFARGNGVVARQGGDEFTLFLYDYNTEEELLETIESLRYIQDNSSAYLTDDLKVQLRFSFGFCITKGNADYEYLMKQADKEMYINKQDRKLRESQSQPQTIIMKDNKELVWI